MHLDAEFFVALGFVIFVLLGLYMGVHNQITKGLDDRAKLVADELAEAARLRAEAQAVLASFEKKRVEAEAQAAAIVTQARAEAEALAKEAQTRLNDFVVRRTKQAEAKIAMAEVQATADVRAAAADAAVRAAGIVLTGQARGETGNALLMQGIADMKQRLN